MLVREAMSNAVLQVGPGHTLRQAAQLMSERKVGSAVVLDPDSEGLGIITERDVLKIVGEGQDPKNVSLRDAMTSDVVTIRPDTSIKDAAEIMFQKWFRHLPVTTENGKVVGIISLRDLLTIVAEGMKEPDTLQPLLGHQLVRDARSDRLQRIEAGDLD